VPCVPCDADAHAEAAGQPTPIHPPSRSKASTKAAKGGGASPAVAAPWLTDKTKNQVREVSLSLLQAKKLSTFCFLQEVFVKTFVSSCSKLGVVVNTSVDTYALQMSGDDALEPSRIAEAFSTKYNVATVAGSYRMDAEYKTRATSMKHTMKITRADAALRLLEQMNACLPVTIFLEIPGVASSNQTLGNVATAAAGQAAAGVTNQQMAKHLLQSGAAAPHGAGGSAALFGEGGCYHNALEKVKQDFPHLAQKDPIKARRWAISQELGCWTDLSNPPPSTMVFDFPGAPRTLMCFCKIEFLPLCDTHVTLTVFR